MKTTAGFLDTALPLAAAPMAGGATTTDLGEAAARAGALPFLAGGYRSAEALAAQIREARSWGSPFGVNLFAPGPDEVDAAAFARYAERLAPEAQVYGVGLDPRPVRDDDGWAEKLALLCEDPVPVVSFTFALPRAADIARLRAAGSRVLVSVTTVEEARAAEESGVDGLVVQGPSAGGHSATWDPGRPIADGSTAALVAAVRAATSSPILAAGGVDGPSSVQSLLRAGASAVAVGTLLLRTDESGASETHRRALGSSGFSATSITRAFTGRPARTLRNGFVERHDAAAITAYPAVHHLTRELRRRAALAGDGDRLHLWAGTGFRAARTGPAGDVLRALAARL